MVTSLKYTKARCSTSRKENQAGSVQHLSCQVGALHKLSGKYPIFKKSYQMVDVV